MPELFAWIGHGLLRGSAARRPAPASFFADAGFPRGRRRDEDVARGQRTAACREVPRGRRSVRLRCRGSRSSSEELARRQTRAAGQADLVGRYVAALNEGDTHALETVWPGGWWFGMGTEGTNSPRRPGPADRRSLTPREREVAELVAAGLTNPHPLRRQRPGVHAASLRARHRLPRPWLRARAHCPQRGQQAGNRGPDLPRRAARRLPPDRRARSRQLPVLDDDRRRPAGVGLRPTAALTVPSLAGRGDTG